MTASSVYLHDVSDPGNVGTVMRAAHAFGAGAVILSERTADPYGPKAVRASMGAVFAVPIARAKLDEARASLGLPAVALVRTPGRRFASLDLGGAALFVLGAERTGLPEDARRGLRERRPRAARPGCGRVPERRDDGHALSLRKRRP